MPLSVGDRLGPYEILAPLGKGGMGEVYRARDTRLGREVAIKVSVERFSERFEREARAIAALNHPNVCTLYDVGPDYLVMELVEGPTLADRIKEGPIPVEEALRLARQIAEALEAAHEKGIVHRDLKPANVKIKPDGLVKVLDFGLAKAMDPRDSSASDLTASPTLTLEATRAGIILGTAAYMSPEQARGKPVDKRADIWAFGVVLYEMLTGALTFEGETVSDTLAAVLRADIDWSRLPAATPPKVRRLLKRCLERDPKRRLRDIADAWIEIDAPEEPQAAAPPAKSSRAARWLPWIAAAVIAAAGVAWGLFHSPAAPLRPVFRWTYNEPSYFGLVNLSRDGTRLVYTQLSGGSTRIMLRTPDDAEPRPIAGSEDGLYPFLSPDAQWCGYFTRDEKLKKIPITGGSPIVLVDGGAEPPADWGDDDTIVFARRQGIARVSASGGAPQMLTTVDPKKGETAHQSPRFLPGGRGLLFTIATGAASQVVVRDLKSGVTRVLVTNASGGRYASTGHLVYQRGNTLFAAPFDLRRLAVTGPEAAMVQSTSTAFSAGGDYAFGDSGVLVYMSGVDLTGATVLAWADRKGSLEMISEPKPWGTGQLSPDGLRVANSVVAGGGADIWVFDTVRRTLNRLTSVGTGQNPIWSPDGRRIAFGGTLAGKSGIYTVPADGSGKPELLVAADTSAAPTSWAPDGRRLVYLSTGSDHRSRLWSVTLPDGVSSPLHDTPYTEEDGRVSPDGRWIAYVSNESGANEIYLQPFPGPGGKVRVSTHGGDRPRWSRSGRELYYWGGLNAGLAVIDVQTTPEVHVGLPQNLFQLVAGTTFGVAPDEKRFLVEAIPGLQTGRRMEIIVNWFDELRRRAPVR